MTPGSVSPAKACAQIYVLFPPKRKMAKMTISEDVKDLSWVRFHVPVEDATDKGRDESAAKLGGGNGLCHAEHEGEVAGYALLLQDLGHACVTQSTK